MSVIDETLSANAAIAHGFDPGRGKPPTPRIAIVTCVDPRLTDIEQMLGLADRAGQVPQLHRRGGQCQGADSQGPVASVDIAGDSGPGFGYDVSTERVSEVFPDGTTVTG
jgi:hypothetical protein